MPMIHVSLAAALLSLSPVTESRPTIIRRHDVADSLYRVAASRIRGLVHIELSNKPNVGDGEGTLVAPRWVLTAAHVAEVVRTGHRVSVGTEQLTVDRICRHPGHAGDPPHDIALLHLTTAATADLPIPLYRGSDEVGKTIWVAGYGDSGTGLTGAVIGDHVVRAATNRVEEASPYWLIFTFDGPASARATALEGISGPGDSGGPAYLDAHGRRFVAGVSSRQDIGPSGGKEGRYGVREMYTRVSTHVRWLESTMAGKTCPNAN